MHSSSVLSRSDFQLTHYNKSVTHEDFFADFAITDRLGLVAPSRCEGPGAIALIMAHVTAFYDRYRSVKREFFAYPDFFSFQRQEPLASYSMFDIWPDHKNVLIPYKAGSTAEAITDRAINILVIPDEPARQNNFERVQLASLERNVRHCYLYGVEGHVDDPTLEVVTVAEPMRKWSAAVFDSLPPDDQQRQSRESCLEKMGRDNLRQTYREISLEDALQRL